MHLHRPEQRIGETMSGIIGGAGSKSGVIGTTELDYEEGTVTNPLIIAGSTTADSYYSSGVRYIKIGKLVNFEYITLK